MVDLDFTDFLPHPDPFGAAFAAIQNAGGGRLRLPPGRFPLTRIYALTNVPFTLTGAGVDVTVLEVSGDGGFRHSTASPHLSSTTWRGFTMEAQEALQTPGIELVRTDGDKDHGTGIRDISKGDISRVKLMCAFTKPEANWTLGINLSGARNVTIRNCEFANNERNMFGIAVRMARFWCHNTQIRDCFFRFWNHGVQVMSGPEGTMVSSCEFVPCVVGVYSDNTDPGGDYGYGKPHTVVDNCHFNVERHAIKSLNGSQWFVMQNLIYLYGNQAEWAGLWFRSANGLIVANNIHIETPPNGQQVSGMFLDVDNVQKLNAHHNQVWWANRGIRIGSSVIDRHLSGNTIRARLGPLEDRSGDRAEI